MNQTIYIYAVMLLFCAITNSMYQPNNQRVIEPETYRALFWNEEKSSQKETLYHARMSPDSSRALVAVTAKYKNNISGTLITHFSQKQSHSDIVQSFSETLALYTKKAEETTGKSPLEQSHIDIVIPTKIMTWDFNCIASDADILLSNALKKVYLKKHPSLSTSKEHIEYAQPTYPIQVNFFLSDNGLIVWTSREKKL